MEILFGQPQGKIVRVWMSEDDVLGQRMIVIHALSCETNRMLARIDTENETMVVYPGNLHDVGLRLDTGGSTR